jgi:CubicO group peptidase (beta-lactamase class C family)
VRRHSVEVKEAGLKSKIVLAILVTITAVPAHADRLDNLVNSQMKELHIPGVVIIVQHDGTVEEQRAYGLANIEFDVPMTVQDVFPIASITKLFTATAVLELVQDHKIRLEDKVSSIVPGLPSLWNEITILQCLNHTSGLPDLYEGTILPIASTPEEAIHKLSMKPLAFRPGEKTRYNQTEFMLLQMVIEKVSRRSYQEFMADGVFQPLGMKTARFADARDIIPRKITLYSRLTPDASRLELETRNGIAVPSDRPRWIVPYLYPDSVRAGAGLVMSAPDLARFDAALTAKKLLSPRMLELMWTPAKLPNGLIGDFTAGWQYWGQEPHTKKEIVGHNGGSGVEYIRTVDGQYSIIVFTDCPEALTHIMAMGILNLYLGPTIVSHSDLSFAKSRER